MKTKNFPLVILSIIFPFFLFSCSGSFLIQKTAEFENKIWLVQSIDYNDIPNADGKIYIKFEREEKKLTGYGGCNNIVGSYSIT
ncbi:MAG TPA: META domain-containing protein, partial [Ignavibacteria bacterium]